MSMKYIVCSVRDKAAEVFGQPFCVPAIGLAVRGFSDQVNRAAEDNPLFNHPEHFDLYEIGSYEDSTGVLDSSGADLPRVLMRGLDARAASSR